MQLHIEHCPRDLIEPLMQTLEETEALSITLTDQQDTPILEPELGTTPLWPWVVVEALYAEHHEAQWAQQQLLNHYPDIFSSIHTLPDKDWERVCMENFKPQRFGNRLWVCPTWLTPPDPTAVNLRLDPGLAFGTGTHPTTYLCLTWLEQAPLHQKTIIDYGCGSGILALAALKLGAAHASAIDIDEQALLATQNNALSNEILTTQLGVYFPDASVESADIVIANILLTPLISLKTRFHHLLKQNGLLVVSGILESQIPTLIQAYQTDFEHCSSHIHDDWALLVFSSR